MIERDRDRERQREKERKRERERQSEREFALFLGDLSIIITVFAYFLGTSAS